MLRSTCHDILSILSHIFPIWFNVLLLYKMLTNDSVVLLLFVIIYSTYLFKTHAVLLTCSFVLLVKKHKGTKLILNLASSKCQAN